MPLSVYRGRETVSRTVYSYDDQGRVTEARTAAEPAWLESDRWLALALDVYEASLCPGCREPQDRAWHIDMDGWYERVEHECFACKARSGEQVKYAEVRDTRPADRPLHPLPHE